MKFFDIDFAFNFVSSAEYGMNSAYLCKDTGKIYYESAFGDSDELPDDFEDSDRYIEIPHKRDLGLGAELVFDFIDEHLPDKAQEVEKIFRSKGAYSKFKELLSRSGLLEKWYEFEQVKAESALIKWCIQNDIEIEDKSTDDKHP